MPIVMDVVQPTPTAYIPKTQWNRGDRSAGRCFSRAGGWTRGENVAQWLNEHGVTAFVLKYRLARDDPSRPELNFFQPAGEG